MKEKHKPDCALVIKEFIDLWFPHSAPRKISLLFKEQQIKYRKSLESQNWNPGLIHSLQVSGPLLNNHLRGFIPYSFIGKNNVLLF